MGYGEGGLDEQEKPSSSRLYLYDIVVRSFNLNNNNNNNNGDNCT